MPSFTSIPNPERLLAEYCSSAKGFGWPMYDQDFARNELCGADLAAPALLSYPIAGSYLNKMGQTGTEYAHLVAAMHRFLEADPQLFWEIESDRIAELATRERGSEVADDAFGRLVACLDAVQATDGLKSVFVTKVLHRKRPTLVPILDARVRRFYGTGPRYAGAVAAIHEDVTTYLERLVELGSTIPATSGATLGPLRVLDILVWMHMSPDPGDAAESID